MRIPIDATTPQAPGLAEQTSANDARLIVVVAEQVIAKATFGRNLLDGRGPCPVELALHCVTGARWELCELSARAPSGVWYRLHGSVAEYAALWHAGKPIEPFAFVLNVAVADAGSLVKPSAAYSNHLQQIANLRKAKAQSTHVPINLPQAPENVLAEMQKQTDRFHQWMQRRRPVYGYF